MLSGYDIDAVGKFFRHTTAEVLKQYMAKRSVFTCTHGPFECFFLPPGLIYFEMVMQDDHMYGLKLGYIAKSSKCNQLFEMFSGRDGTSSKNLAVMGVIGPCFADANVKPLEGVTSEGPHGVVEGGDCICEGGRRREGGDVGRVHGGCGPGEAGGREGGECSSQAHRCSIFEGAAGAEGANSGGVGSEQGKGQQPGARRQETKEVRLRLTDDFVRRCIEGLGSFVSAAMAVDRHCSFLMCMLRGPASERLARPCISAMGHRHNGEMHSRPIRPTPLALRRRSNGVAQRMSCVSGVEGF